MSDSTPSSPALLPTGASPYSLSSDLSRLCLPTEFKEPHRKLAWANSICFLFLLVGLVGLKPPKVVQKPLSNAEDIVPVVLAAPPEQPKAEPEVKQDESIEPQEAPTEAPQVVTVVAAADSAAVAFPIPVKGAVAVTPVAARATAPPPPAYEPPKPTRFNPDTAGEGSFPPPQYPSLAQRNRYQGTVTIEIMVDASGGITSAKVQKSSGFSILDEAALNVVKQRWRFPPGKERWLIWPCTFQLQ